MTQETIRGLSDVELQQVITWAADEQKARAAKRKQETIAKIKALAAQGGINIAIEGVRGRPNGAAIRKQTSLSSNRSALKLKSSSID